MAKRTKKQVGFEWDVQPYQFMSELRRNYTQAVRMATQNHAQILAKEATQWMRNNAPWKDTDITSGRGPDKRVIYPAGTARKGLFVRVIQSKEDIRGYREGLERAQKLDALTKRDIRAEVGERREAARRRLSRLEHGEKEDIIPGVVRNERGELVQGEVFYPAVAPDPRKASRLRINLKRQAQYRVPRSIPRGRSNVAAFQQEWKGKREPLVQVKFSHNRDLYYAIWLEIANQGRFGIISRALHHFAPKMFNEIKKISTLVQYRNRIASLPSYPTQQEQFQRTVEEYERFEGKPYRPWSPERQRDKTRIYNRGYYREGRRKEPAPFVQEQPQKIVDKATPMLSVNIRNTRAGRR
jgi:hypothetical protein